eukprot:2562839-Prymnesium_polylepis.1
MLDMCAAAAHDWDELLALRGIGHHVSDRQVTASRRSTSCHVRPALRMARRPGHSSKLPLRLWLRAW